MKKRSTVIWLKVADALNKFCCNWRELSRELLGLAGDEMHFTSRQGLILLVLIGLPLFYPPVISGLYSHEQAIERPVAVIDLDNSEISRQMITMFDATQQAQVVQRLGSLEKGWDLLKRWQVEMIVYIPEDFSSSLKRTEQSSVKVWVNTANMYTYSLSYAALKNVVLEINKEFGIRFFGGKAMTHTLAERRVMPIDSDVCYLFHESGSYGNFFVPGIFIIVIQQLMIIAFAAAIGLRKEKGLYDYAYPKQFTYLVGRMLAQFAFFIFAVILMLFLFTPLFGWTLQSTMSVTLLFLFFMLPMAPIAIALAHLTGDEYAPFQILMFASTPLFMMSGFAWPFSQMPTYIKVIGTIFPATPALQALRILTLKSASLTVVCPFLMWLLAQFVVYSLLALLIVKRIPATHPPHNANH